MDFAVVKIAGKQHLVKVGDQVVVDAILGEKGNISFPEVLVLSLGDQVKIGTPFVEGVKVKAEILGTGKGEKIYVRKFKAKARYRRTTGFRALQTTLKITEISSGKSSEEKPAKKVTKKTK